MIDLDGILCVAVDGTWQKRGHTSLNGILSITSVDTGKVLDIYLMSKFCDCPGRVQSEHLASCKANYIGTSGGMEAEGATTLFGRSVQKYKVQYTEYLGDGDSNGYEAVERSQPFDADVSIQKLECVGHVQKRIGTRIRNVIAKNKGRKLADRRALSGKNGITNKAIKKYKYFMV